MASGFINCDSVGNCELF